MCDVLNPPQRIDLSTDLAFGVLTLCRLDSMSGTTAAAPFNRLKVGKSDIKPPDLMPLLKI